MDQGVERGRKGATKKPPLSAEVSVERGGYVCGKGDGSRECLGAVSPEGS